MITKTSLTHPTMIAKIRLAMHLAGTKQGHLMNGHGNRCYIQNRKGHNIMRLQCDNGVFTIYGSESVNITNMVCKVLDLYKD